MQYYIYAKCKGGADGLALFWLPEGKGYTRNISAAGRFNQETAFTIATQSEGDHLAISEDHLPVTEAVLDICAVNADPISTPEANHPRPTPPPPPPCPPLTHNYGPKDYPEDSPHENGDYRNECIQCEASFLGHKRRLSCKECSTENKARWEALSGAEQQAALEDMQKALSSSKEPSA